jgi:hypothetical protein
VTALETRRLKGLGSFFGIGVIAGCLAALTLSPTGGTSGDPFSESCTTREVSASVTANTWAEVAVCDASQGEVAIAPSGSCPTGVAMIGLGLTGGGSFDQSVWLRCAASGHAGFYATCCK